MSGTSAKNLSSSTTSSDPTWNSASHRAADSHGAERLLHRFLGFLGRPERDLLAGLDLGRLASRRVPSRPSGTLSAPGECRARSVGPIALLEVPGRERHQVAQHGLGLLLWQVMAVRQGGGQMLERDGHLRRGFRRGGGLLGCGGGFLGWRDDDLPDPLKVAPCSLRLDSGKRRRQGISPPAPASEDRGGTRQTASKGRLLSRTERR
jgi:hypothetical protein